MNKHLQAILDLIQQSGSLTPEEKKSLADAVKESDKEITITEFKLERTEKVKRTTGILLEETIAELEQKRKAVEIQNRELEIEAALERVRSRSIAMRQSSELGDLSFELVKQVQALGIATWHCAFNIYDEDQESSTEWGSNANGTYPIYKTPREGIFKRYYEIGQRGETLHVEVIGEDKCADHYAYLCTLPGVGDTLIKVRDSGIPFPKSQIDHVAYFKYGYLLFITFEPAPEAHDIFKRFAKVFEQTYTRFLDLQQAEAQAREAQVETSLERVRSRSMGMQKSEELKEVIHVVYEQFVHLKIHIEHTGFIMDYKEREDMLIWLADQHEVPSQVVIPYFDSPHWNSFLKAKENGIDFFANRLTFEEKNKFYQQLFKLIPGLPDEAKEYYFSCPGLAISTVLLDNIGLYIENFKGIPYSDEENVTLMRFGKVFQQTYTRFLDLQKAEAQTRLAQIEVSLERVRARAMGMHHSDELSEVLSVLFDQFDVLGIQPVYTFLSLIDLHKNKFTYRQTGKGGQRVIAQQVIDLDKMEEWKDLFENMRAGKIDPINCLHYPKESLEKVWEVFDEIYSALPEGSKVYPEDFPDGVYTTQAYCKFGYLGFDHTRPASEEDKDVLQRFANEFTRLYQRFLDLQKAEAQAREAKIETALERIRAKAIGMHHSNELSDVLTLLFQQYDLLDIHPVSTMLNLFDIDNNQFTHFTTGRKGKYTMVHQTLALDASDAWSNSVDEWKKMKSQSISTSHFPLEIIPHIFELFKELRAGMPESERIQVEDFPHGIFQTVANCKFGSIGFLHSREATEEEKEITVRFAKEFERLYQRFLDLQKSEAQAREAQIEAALERVRSRTMAMQRSEELVDVASVLFQQVKALGVPQWNCGFNIWEIGDKEFTYYPGSPDGIISPSPCKIPLTEHPVFISFDDSRKRGDELFVYEKEGEFQADHYRYMLSLRPGVGDLLQSMLNSGFQLPTFQIDHLANFSYGNLIFITFEHFPEMHDVFKRFAKVFEQTYTRFLDLQKAEAQTREAQIEASLERVRSKAMAMHKSEDLTAAVAVVFEELEKLDIGMSRCGIGILNKEKRSADVWTTSKLKEQNAVDVSGDESMDIHPLLQKAFDAWVRQEDFNYILQGEDLADYYRALQHTNFRLPESDVMVKNAEMLHHHYYMTSFQAGALYAFREHPFTDEAKNVMKRFANVFNLTYKRFQDIQKAEAQVRESQIEAALERVRSKTMAMHNSQDVGDTVATLFDELTKLGVKTNRCGILVFGDSDVTEVWTAKSNPSGKANLIIGHLDVASHPMLTSARNTWKNKETSFSYEMVGDDLINYYQTISNQPRYRIQVNMDALPSKEIHTEFYFPEGAVFAFTSEQIPVDHTLIFKRLAGVFGQTYRRYLDLQKAEAQARESQIEAALERVRSRTMAMHRSEEIADIVGRILKELTLLDVALNRVLIWIFNAEEKYITWWSANPEAESNAESYRVDYVDHPVFLTYYEAWQKRSPLLLYTLGDDLKDSWEDHLFKNTELSRLPTAVQDGMRSEGKIFTTSAISDYGLLMAGCFEPFSDEINDIIQRFGRVFQQSYTRYVDVQKAEAQAREATIESSLEKVRGKAMAMHNSNDLISTASLVFIELRKLGIDSFRSGVGLLTKENRKVKLFSATSSEEGGSLSLVGWAVLDHHPVLSKTYDSWINNEDYYPVLKGESLKTYYEQVVSTFTVPVEHSEGYEQFGYFLPFSEGLFYGWSEKPYTDAEIKILHRFRAIVDLTFRRYMELQKSEENAIEAIRQASLDRVRAEIASMRTTADLDRITPLIWKELGILGVPFVRCGVFIMDEPQHQIHTFLSSSDGKAIAAFNLPYETAGNVGEILTHWLDKQTYINHWDETAFSELGEQLFQQGAIPSTEVYMKTVPPGGLHLHCLPFLQGMLYVGNTMPLQETDIHLIQSVADAFSTAYARYEDFNKLESAKVQIEKTLTDLKQTQNLLVQSEKMASLGELTAGIAHEIQNPLNFVNNFSEVSNELLEEMKEEIDKGNFDEVQSITNNIKQNLDKILHHGKRADGIVKGMLQHSRSSSGVKEPTDINALADEYLRLAYHGFRAKDKSFNASTNTDLDKSIGKINVVPQDIGRVVLNLITNAFYAVTEKQHQTTTDYQPTVYLSTKRRDDCVLITVKDNGNGIPEQIREKIFQPFFTTKPTGQGTGLGLSLSYDIVKAHGGELSVETTEGEGSEFVITIMF